MMLLTTNLPLSNFIEKVEEFFFLSPPSSLFPLTRLFSSPLGRLLSLLRSERIQPQRTVPHSQTIEIFIKQEYLYVFNEIFYGFPQRASLSQLVKFLINRSIILVFIEKLTTFHKEPLARNLSRIQ